MQTLKLKTPTSTILRPADLGSYEEIIAEAEILRRHPLLFQHLGKNKTLLMVFFNASLRTRLSTQKAAMQLGMNVMVLDVTKDSWKLETEYGVVMDGDKAEHLKESIPVMGTYCDIIAVRSFAKLTNRKADYEEQVLDQFIEYAGVPVVNMESAIRHPLQGLADLITIEQFKKQTRPKVVLSWAPHVKALPQAVPNSFLEWMACANVELVITHPSGYRLADEFMHYARFEANQDKALEGADFVYAKNWSSVDQYGKILLQDASWMITEDKMKRTNQAYFMHCLPVRRNVVVSDDVLDSPNSIVIAQASNRVVSAQMVLKHALQETQSNTLQNTFAK
ncbi:MAG: N-acetylornithine carbamoyltransferase [Flavobacteriales bacterium]